MKIATRFLPLIVCLLFSPLQLSAQSDGGLTFTAESLIDGKPVELDKLPWRYRAGDERSWSELQFDDGAWEQIEGTRINLKSLPRGGWNGRAWFRLRVKVDESVADKTFALVGRQIGASEVYLDGRLLARFGEISEAGETEYNPSRLPVPFKFGGAGEHLFAVRYSSAVMSDLTSGRGAWLTRGGIRPGFSFALVDASDVKTTIQTYAYGASMRPGFFFIGVLLALALLHFLLFVFYRAERANLYYSIYAAASALNLVCGNFLASGHQGVMASVTLGIATSVMLAAVFIALLTFLHVAFRRSFGIIFWTIAAMWALSIVIKVVFLSNSGWFNLVPSVAIFLSFSFSIYLLVGALKEGRAGARILLGGVQLFSLGMFSLLLRQFNFLNLPGYIYELSEIALILAVPVAVSVFLARNFARTNRELEEQLAQVKQLSLRQIEQERQAAILRAENERRAKELEEARQLQLSMLPKRLPQVPNLEIAAYMKPATEVGGDYYDFHVGADGTLTVAVGDATGHGLKAGTMVTAAKTLFRNYADEADIPHIFSKSSRVLKEMNLRGLFMAMTMLKIKDNRLVLCTAGMPSMLIFRAAEKSVEEVTIRAVPLGSLSNIAYQQQEVALSAGDAVLLMSDGFPEMFNEAGEMLVDGKAMTVLAEVAGQSSQEIINRLVEVGEAWAGARAQDDDVTFVVLKIK